MITDLNIYTVEVGAIIFVCEFGTYCLSTGSQISGLSVNDNRWKNRARCIVITVLLCSYILQKRRNISNVPPKIFPSGSTGAVQKNHGVCRVFTCVRCRYRAINVNVLKVVTHYVVFSVFMGQALDRGLIHEHLSSKSHGGSLCSQ